jgi:hypothetical protein
MFAFIKKLFGSKPQEVEVAAPYKVEITETYTPAAEAPPSAAVEVKSDVKKPPVKRSPPPKKNPAASTGTKQGQPRGRKPKVQ